MTTFSDEQIERLRWVSGAAYREQAQPYIIHVDAEEAWGELVSAESREAIRDSARLGLILMELGLGNVVVTAGMDLDEILEQIHNAVRKLKQKKDGEIRTEILEVVVPTDPVVHGHHVQYRLVDTDDRVVDQTEWVPESTKSVAMTEIVHKRGVAQLEGKDVFIQQYNRCNHVNLTTVVEREA